MCHSRNVGGITIQIQIGKNDEAYAPNAETIIPNNTMANYGQLYC